MKYIRFLWHFPRNVAIELVAVYQKTLSPDHSRWGKALFRHGACRFTPTCSEYMKQALVRYGLIRGLAKGVWRIFRCNPWSNGGEDQV